MRGRDQRVSRPVIDNARRRKLRRLARPRPRHRRAGRTFLAGFDLNGAAATAAAASRLLAACGLSALLLLLLLRNEQGRADRNAGRNQAGVKESAPHDLAIVPGVVSGC